MVKLAVLGTGFIANLFMKAASELSDVSVEAVLAINEEDAREFTGKYGISKGYTDYDQLLDDEEITFVYIGLPNHLHFSYAKKALEHGKNVIVEKPFVSETSEVDELLKTAKSNNRMIFDAIFTRYIPTMDSLKKSLPKVGQIKNVTNTYCQYSSRFDKVREGNIPSVFNLENDGGALKDLGIYSINFLVLLFGKPKTVKYYANKLENGCDSSGVLIMEYEGFIATSIIAKDSFTENRCTVEGCDGTLFVDDDCFRFPNVRFRKNKKDDGELIDTLKIDGMVNEFHYFMKTYQAGDFETCYSDIERSRVAIEVLKEAAQSAGLVYGKAK